MQFNIRNHAFASNANSFGTLLTTQEAETRFAVADDSMKRSVPGAATRILLECAAGLAPDMLDPGSWPDHLATAVTLRLGAAVEAEGGPAWLMFAAVAIRSGTVHVCTAGDIRIHLVKDMSAVHSTRDHVLKNESIDWIRGTYGDIEIADHETMVTRSLGNCSLPPTSDTWRSDPPFTVVVCSSEYHRHRKEDAYLSGLLELTANASEVSAEGVLARFDFS